MAMSKRWVFTLNNYTEEEEEAIKLFQCLYLVYGKEIGESGTPHLQGFITFKSNKRLSGLKKLNGRAYWAVAKGTSLQASDYCKKEGDYFEVGVPPSPGQRSDLAAACEVLKERGVQAVAQDHPTLFVRYGRGFRDLSHTLEMPYEHDAVRGIWIHGEPGSGKSYWARNTYPGAYIKAQNKWFDGYDRNEVIILDDLDTNVLAHHLKIWADRYACTGETKGGTVALRHKVFIVTSNWHPSDLIVDPIMYAAIERRFIIREKILDVEVDLA